MSLADPNFLLLCLQLFANFCFVKIIALWLGLSAKDEYNSDLTVSLTCGSLHQNQPSADFVKSHTLNSIAAAQNGLFQFS